MYGLVCPLRPKLVILVNMPLKELIDPSDFHPKSVRDREYSNPGGSTMINGLNGVIESGPENTWYGNGAGT